MDSTLPPNANSSDKEARKDNEDKEDGKSEKNNGGKALSDSENAAPAPSGAVNATDLLSEHFQQRRVKRTGSRSAQAQSERLHVPAWLVAVGAFVLGAALSALVMHQRHAADRVIVAVNGETIREPEFYGRLEAAAGPQVLRQMVEETLTRQYAQQRNLLPTQAEIQAKAAQISAQSAFASSLNRPLTRDQVQRMAQAQSLQERLLGQGTDVTDAEVQAYYRAQTDPRNPSARFLRPETARLAVIVTPSEAQARQAEKALQQGEPFATVAKNYSQDKSAARGGEMPPILRGRTPARQVSGLEDVIFSLHPGQITRPQKLAGVWWIMNCLEKTPSETLPYAQVQAQCREEARLLKAQKEQGAQVEADFEKYCRSVPVQVFWERYSTAVLTQEHKLTPGKF